MEKKHFNDLLMPIILTICILPFVTRMAVYDYGYSKYEWHSNQSILEDFYTYYKANIFYVILFFAIAILALRLTLYKDRTKSIKVFLPLAGYALFTLVSAIFSINSYNSWTGHFVDAEGVGVILGYIIIAFYTYQIMEQENDYSTLINAIVVMFIFMSVLGWLQIFKHDVLNYEWIQKLVMSKSQFEEYGGSVQDIFTGNNVYLTLGNPNYAAVFLVMFDCLFMAMSLFSEKKKDKIKYTVLLIDALILTWFTYTRTAIVAIIVAAVIMLVYRFRKGNMKKLAYVVVPVLGVIVVLLCVDILMGSKFINRIVENKNQSKLELIETKKDKVLIKYDSKEYGISIDDVLDEAKTVGKSIKLPFGKDYTAAVENYGAEDVLVLSIEGEELSFVKENNKYLYESPWGKNVEMSGTKKVNFGGYESLGSGRVYIWSRIIPKLTKYILIGSGPETFAEVFPQDDYTGKLLYAGTTARIIERAHNDYLMKWIQTGLISVLCIVAFYFILLKKSILSFKNRHFNECSEIVGFGCFVGCVAFMVCGLFIDSTIYATPVFFVFAGVVLSVVNRKENKK